MDTTTLKVILLAILQGIGEFLPISSKGHLIIGQSLLGMKGDMLSFDILLHGGTLLALLVFFHRELIDLITPLFSTPIRDYWGSDRCRLPIFILLASVPTGVIGLLGHNMVEKMFESIQYTALGLTVVGFAMLYCHYQPLIEKPVGDKLGLGDAMILGTVQGCAIFPGLSRSGSTISALSRLGYNLEEAGKISFLLSLPAVSGALLLKAKKILVTGIVGITSLQAMIGFTVSYVTGYLFLKIAMKLLGNKTFFLFGYYCLLLGGIVTAKVVFYGP